MLNHIDIMGRLTADPELRRTGSNIAVVSFTIACDRDLKNAAGNRDTDFIEVVAWRKLGEFIARNFRKGSRIIVSGRLQVRVWTDKDGNKRRTAEILAENAYFPDSKNSDNGNSGYVPPAQPADDEYARLDGEDAQFPF